METPATFLTLQHSPPREVPLVRRDDVDDDVAAEILDAVAAVAWSDVHHAYGVASDVPAQLIAVTVGDEPTRKDAWWNLWGNIHHQGTVYEATVPATPIIARLAGWSSYPDRVEAIWFLREIAAAAGVAVWDRDKPDPELDAALAHHVREHAAALLRGWREEPADVRRALLWLLSALPVLQAEFSELIDAELPGEHRHGFSVVPREATGDAEVDAYYAFDEWATGGG